MATNILALGEVSIPCSIRTNADWIDAIAFYDPVGNPLALDGIAIELQARPSVDASDVLLDASIAAGTLGLGSTGALAQALTPGIGYAIGDGIALAGGSRPAGLPATLTVAALALVAGVLTSAGTAHAPGDVLTFGAVAPGVAAAPATLQVDGTDSTGRITAWHVLSGGAFTAAPIALVQIASTGTGTGAALGTPSWGVAAARMTSAGTYATVPSNPVAQATSTGAGQGATFALTWVNNVLCIQVPLSGIKAYLIRDAAVYEIRATADGYTEVVVSGPLTVAHGVVR